MSNQHYNYADIKKILSEARMSTYEAESKNLDNAFTLYQQNFDISGAFLPVLHVCEVVIRNAVAFALEEAYGDKWAWNTAFLISLPNRNRGYSPAQDLKKASENNKKIGNVISDLKFVFWQKMFTKRHDGRLWNNYFNLAFPNCNKLNSLKENRGRIHDDLEKIRTLRNRIAHHEPIFNRDLRSDYDLIIDLIKCRCLATSFWLENNQKVTQKLIAMGKN